MSARRASSPPLAVANIILSMGLLATGNGVLFAYIPLKLAFEGFAPWVAGTMITALAAGGIGGCLLTGALVRRVGHARVFAAMIALVILGVLVIALGTQPAAWILARGIYGFAMTGIFIVSQSWLNDACENAWRGKVIAIFYMTYVMAIGAGGYVLKFVSLESLDGPLLGIFFAALAILPVSLTRLPTPAPPESVTVAIGAVWRISPVGFLGLLTVGGLTMLVAGFAPIYAAAEGYTKDDIALLLFLMQFGMIGVQYPLGALSDRMDRRYVLIAAAAIVIASAALATQMSGVALMWLILVFAIWSGATESIYAVANAHANDRAEPQYYVSLSSTLLVAWSISGFVLPGIATALTQVFGLKAFMYVAMVAAGLYGSFVIYRVTRREPAPSTAHEPYLPITAQVPYTAEMGPQAHPQPLEEPDRS
jgi:MFS family permease